MYRFAPVILLASLLTSTIALGEKSHVWKMTYSVLDAQKAADFCKKILGLEQISIPDETLAKGRAWVKFPDSVLELHFVEAQKWRYGYNEIVKAYNEIDSMDNDMSVFTTFMDNHGR